VSTGRTCDGYDIVPVVSNRSSGIPSGTSSANVNERGIREPTVTLNTNLASALMSRISSSSISTIRPLSVPGTTQERRALAYFQSRTAPWLSGYFDSDFWNGLLQIGHSEPGLRYAMNAVSAMYERTLYTNSLPTVSSSNQILDHNQAFALSQYNKAIGHLVKTFANKKQSFAVSLISCVLFICLEFLQHNVENSIVHVRNGLKILETMSMEGYGKFADGARLRLFPESQTMEESVLQIFTRLDIQSGLFSSPSSYYTELEPHQTPNPPAPEQFVFADYKKARISMDHLMNACLSFVIMAGKIKFLPVKDFKIIAEQLRLQSRLECWLVGFKRLINATQSQMTPEDVQAMNMLHILHRISKVWLAICLSPTEMACDVHLEDYELLLDSAESLISSMPPQNCFTFEMGYIAPVYFVALKCRYPTLRRRAIKLLADFPRQEGLWHSTRAASIASRVAAIEEAHIPPEILADPTTGPDIIPAHSRIHDAIIVSNVLYNPCRSLITFSQRVNEPDGGWCFWQEEIPWGVFDDGEIRKNAWEDFKANGKMLFVPNECYPTDWGKDIFSENSSLERTNTVIS
jgi:hypothetical protein